MRVFKEVLIKSFRPSCTPRRALRASKILDGPTGPPAVLSARGTAAGRTIWTKAFDQRFLSDHFGQPSRRQPPP